MMHSTIKAFATLTVLFTSGLLLPAGAAQAVVIQLDVANNASPTDPPWATVTINELVNGDIRFTVALSDSADFSKGQASIEQFGFNVDRIDPDNLSFTDMSDGFSVRKAGATMSRFGGFDVAIRGDMGFGLDPLSFTIVSAGDSIASYTHALTNKGFLFAAKLSKDAPMAFIASSAVPLPAAVWLFGSGLLGIIGMARRKRTA
jgi:hypothetical protein